MKKWLVIQSNKKIGPYGDKDCEFLRECFSLQYAIQQNGDIADIWGLRHDGYENKPDFNSYDYIYMEEQYEFDWIPWDEIGKSNAVKMQLCGDIHIHKTYYEWAHLFDIIMHPYKEALEDGQRLFPTKKNIWFPSAMDGRYYTKKDLPRTFNAIWLGTKTRKYVEQLMVDVGLVVGLRAGWDYINTLASSKVALNSRGYKDINYKNFEITGVGTCLVGDYDDSLVELGFIDGVNCYMFHNYDECVYKIREALSNDNWIRIGEKGYKLSREHTYENRIKRLKEILDGKKEGVDY